MKRFPQPLLPWVHMVQRRPRPLNAKTKREVTKCPTTGAAAKKQCRDARGNFEVSGLRKRIILPKGGLLAALQVPAVGATFRVLCGANRTGQESVPVIHHLTGQLSQNKSSLLHLAAQFFRNFFYVGDASTKF